MKILHIIPSYKPAFIYGGPIYSVSTLCEAQAALGHQVFVFATDANGKSNLSVPLKKIQWVNRVGVYYFPRITGDHTHVSHSLWKYLAKNAKNYDVVHLHSWWSILMIGCAWVLKWKNIPFILSPRGMFSTYSFGNNATTLKKRIFFDWFSKPILQKQVFHATAASEQSEIHDLFGAGAKVFTLPNLLQFPNLLPFDIGQHNQRNTIKLLFISRVDPKKGIELLLHAMQQLHKAAMPIHLTIIGSGSHAYENELKKLARSLSIESVVTWKGSVEWRAKFDDILACDVLVLPSYNENFANIVLETLYAGRPVIVSKHVGLSDYVEAQKMGWVIEADTGSIVNAVKQFSEQKQYWQSKSLQMHNQIQADFAITKLAEAYIDNYKTYFKV
ncbi:glycosyltransferase [Parasediminibacterium sp. JCM 36343]|uniref:glycosyltransferase n=1 Tax=Parasediminibacterium sp. JCM 36343 TaxID=3374279 RepID=UPI00397A4634